MPQTQRPESERVTVVVDTVPRLVGFFAQAVLAAALDGVGARGRFVIAIPGGSAATTLLPGLRSVAVPWESTDVFWTDERAVPPDSPDSNFGTARAILFGSGPAAAAQLHPIRLDRSMGVDVTGPVEAALMAAGRIDLALLGLGEDGHTCSLFPGHAALEERHRLLVPVTNAPKPPSNRATLTFPGLARVESIWVGAFGATKAAAAASALTNPLDHRPLAQAVREARRVVFLLDGPAATRLPPGFTTRRPLGGLE